MSEDELKKLNEGELDDNSDGSPFSEKNLSERLDILDSITESFAHDNLLGPIQTHPDVVRTAKLIRDGKKVSKHLHRSF